MDTEGTAFAQLHRVGGRKSTFTRGQTIQRSVSSTLTAGDELFFQLDGACLDVAGETWQIEVCGIHSAVPYHWIQLNLCGNVTYGLTLRADELDAPRIRERLAAWVPHEMMSSPDLRVVSTAAE
jgi:hypothetical protein